MTLEALSKEITQLPKNEQFSLVQSILHQLDSSSSTTLTDEQIAEVDRRFEEVDNETVEGSPANQVYATLKNKYAPRS